MKVIKRNGKIVDFDNDRIINAIENAMRETVNGVDNEISQLIAKQIKSQDIDVIQIEQIQDMVEEYLMNTNRKDVAKRYILYRNNRNKTRNTNKNIGLLSEEFLSKYKHKPSPMNQLGNFVYYRTYSRWLPEEQRREYWWETVRRSVEYNCSLVPTSREEAEKLYDNIYNLRQFLSGRTFWVGGTKVAQKYPCANFNCAFIVLNDIKVFEELFYLLMVGVGVGVRVLKLDVSKLPKIRKNIEVVHKEYSPLTKKKREDNTSLEFKKDVAKISIGDSKEGWSKALFYYLDLLTNSYYESIKLIIFDYDNVRPKGERLITFGGTASGHESIKNMFKKIHIVINNSNEYLSPLNCLDIANIIGENVVVGGVRRTAENGLIDHDDEELINAKNNLYVQLDGQWIENKEISHRKMSNNAIFYTEKPTREKLHWQMGKMRYSGEPSFANAVAASKRRVFFEGLNPCFTGDMTLLTKEGYKTFKELDGTEIDIVNADGNITKGKVWCSGEKEIVEIKLTNGKIIKCTPNHVFMLTDKSECEAKDLKNKRIMPYIDKHKNNNELYIKLGFIQGDGCTGRINSDTHKGLEVNIGNNDEDILNLFSNDIESIPSNKKAYYIHGFNDILIQLGFDGSQLPERVFPITYTNWNIEQKANFLHGCYSANGSVIGKHRVSYKTTSKIFALQLQKALKNDFGIDSYYTTNKAKMVEFYNGEYECKESYDVNIGKFDELIKFSSKIGFYQNYKTEKLYNLIKEKSPMVMSIKKLGIEKVYDFSETEIHWGIVEGFVAHNCFEILLRSKGLCNLITLNVFYFIINEKLDVNKLLEAQRLSVRAGYRMTCVNLELHEWDLVQKEDRLLGCSLTGWQDMVNAVNMTIDEQKELLSKLKNVAIEESKKYSSQLNMKEPLLVTTVKPEGTLSLLPGVSSGVHYSHSPYYIRRIRINSNDPLVKVCEELEYPVYYEDGQTKENNNTKVIEFPVKAPQGRTKFDVSAIEQLETYKMFQEYYVQHNTSITIHVRDNEWDEVEQWIWDNWDSVIGVSFLSLSDSFYPLMPYESITEDEYNKRIKEMKLFIPSLLSKYEKEEVEIDIGNEGCESGVCPIR